LALVISVPAVAEERTLDDAAGSSWRDSKFAQAVAEEPTNVHDVKMAETPTAEEKSGVDVTRPASQQEKSADEIAKELSNPNNSLAKLTFKNQYRWYEGDLPDADDQDNYTLLFQPVFPFSLGQTASGGNAVLFVRPAFPILVDQPVPDVDISGFDWDEVSALGDIVTDVAYGVTEKNGFLWAVGAVSTLPTATDRDVAGKQLRLGPEALLAKIDTWGVYRIFPSHQWDVSGWGDNPSYSMTSCQLVLTFTPGGGWTFGSSPTLNYDWREEEWTIPLHLTAGKTVMFGKMPVNFSLETNYYVEQPDAFGPEWLISFNITPVIPNVIEGWIKGR